jgi:hypothetical protein
MTLAPNLSGNSDSWADLVVKLTPCFISLVIGMTTSWVAFLRYKITRDRLRLTFLSKRVDAYETLQAFYRRISQEKCITRDSLLLIAEARDKSRFLFGERVERHIEKVWRNAVDVQLMWTSLHGRKRLPIGFKRAAVAAREATLMKWMMRQTEGSTKRFAPYLRFD